MFSKDIQRVYEDIKNNILNGVYSPGETLPEKSHALQYGINRSRVRQVFQNLENDGLVYRIPGKGAFISHISEKDLQEVFEMREALEAMASRLAARRRDDSELEQIIKLFQKIESHLSNNEQKYYVEAAQKLHEFILKSCQNSMITSAMEALMVRILRIWKGGFTIPGRMEKAFKEHKEILEAIKDRNEKLAEQKMSQHIASAYSEYLKQRLSS